MVFVTKKFISQFLMPVPLVTALFILGWACVRFSRFKRTGRSLTGCAIVLFLCFGYGVGAERYLFELERSYPPLELEQSGFAALRGSAIVVLGQGFPETSDLPLRYQTSASFQQRLQEGMRLYRKIPDARLFVSLAGDVDSGIKERFMDAYAQEHDLKRDGIRMITSARDTSDEARLAVALAMTNRLVIVTSAAHLPRAVKIFSKELVRCRIPCGVTTGGAVSRVEVASRSETLLIPAPCDYLYVAKSVPPKFRLWSLPLPSVDGLGRTQHALYEWLGNLHEDLSD